MACYHKSDIRFVRTGQMPGAENKADGNILRYVTKAEDDSNEADGLLSQTDF